MEWNAAALRSVGFQGFVPFVCLPISAVPQASGVYVVLREPGADPSFVNVGSGGWFKDMDPNVPIAELDERWIPGAEVLYIGKASAVDKNKRGLRKRLDEYRRFGAGEKAPHRGGRALWQLADRDKLRVAWLATPDDVDPEQVESWMLASFAARHEGRLPFANGKRGRTLDEAARGRCRTLFSGEAQGGSQSGAIDGEEMWAALADLAACRPVFHSEADFQFALAEVLRRKFRLQVRLEVPYAALGPETNALPGRADLVCRSEADRQSIVELKYPTREWWGVRDDERFKIRNHSAADLGRLGFVTDLARLEAGVRVVGGNGIAVLLTNDPQYWDPKESVTAKDREFRLHEGAILRGTRRWAENETHPNTRTIGGPYAARWLDFSDLATPNSAGQAGTRFRALVVDIGMGGLNRASSPPHP